MEILKYFERWVVFGKPTANGQGFVGTEASEIKCIANESEVTIKQVVRVFDQGLSQRLQFVLGKICGLGLDCKSDRSASDLIEDFREAVVASSISNELKVMYTYLAILGRYPSQSEIRMQELNFRFDNGQQFIDAMLSSQEYKNLFLLAGPLHIVDIGLDTLVIDISHTLDYPSNSGIQRVVRMLVRHLVAMDKNVRFIYAESYNLSYCLLPPEKLSKLTHWGKTVGGLASSEMTAPSSGSKPIEVPFFKSGTSILMPELADSKRADLYEALNTIFALNFSLIIYDLIPIFYPEYCVDGVIASYAHQMRLLRFAKKVSCISKSVEKDLRNVIQNIRSEQNSGEIATHYLASDFISRHEPATKKWCKDLPLVLCVGTIEPRKNQSRILNAAVHLMDKGHRFHLKFVGNPGWKNELFLHELSLYQSKGYEVSLYLSATEEDLASLYSECAFVVFCSMAEGFGLPLIEASFFGKACLTSSVGAMKEIGQIIGHCHFIDPSKTDEIEKGMEILLNQREGILSWGSESYGKCLNSWSEYSRSIYRFVTDDRSSPPI